MGNWIGLFIGALIGNRINETAMILFAIAGYLAGYWLSRYLHPSTRYRKQFQQDQEAFRHFLHQATFLMMGHLAKADGKVSRKEIDAAEQIFKVLKFDKARRQEAIRLFNEGKQSHFDIQSILKPLAFEAQRHKDLIRVFLEVQAQIVVADGAIPRTASRPFVAIANGLGFTDQESLNILRQVRSKMAFKAERQKANKESAQRDGANNNGQKGAFSSSKGNYQGKTSSDFVFSQSALGDAYQLLDVEPTCNTKELKTAYRRAMSQHHPDKLHSSGATEQMIHAATEQTQAIQAAYEMISQVRAL